MVKKKKTTKKRKPKGKLLSEALNEKAEVAREVAGDDESEPVAEPYQEASIEAPLQSEPPPRWSEDDDAAEPSDGDDRSAPSDADGDKDDYEDDYEDDDASEQPAGAAGSSDDDESDDDESDDDESDDDESDDDDDDEWEDDDENAAAQMGHRRYVISGFFALWIVVAYITGQTLQAAWSWVASKDWAFEKLPQLAAVPHEGELISRSSVSLVVGGIIAGAVVIHYYVRPDIRTWADEVAEELSKVKWPNRKEIGNHTVVVIAATLVLTLYLTLLDRFWGFVTNLIYSSGA